MLRIFLAASFFTVVFGACDWPNGTDTALHWWQDPSQFCTVYAAHAEDLNGNFEYPINLTRPVVAVLNVTNGGPAANKVQLDISIMEYGGFTGCQWNNVPTFGLLNGLNGCEYAACPIPPGNQIIKLKIDFSQFQNIINLLNDHTPYQLDIKLTNKDTNVEVTAHVQAKVIT